MAALDVSKLPYGLQERFLQVQRQNEPYTECGKKLKLQFLSNQFCGTIFVFKVLEYWHLQPGMKGRDDLFLRCLFVVEERMRSS